MLISYDEMIMLKNIKYLRGQYVTDRLIKGGLATVEENNEKTGPIIHLTIKGYWVVFKAFKYHIVRL